MAIAYNQRNASLCDQLPRSGGFPFVNGSYDSLESCRDTVAAYRRPDFNNGGLHYGPVAFPDATDLSRALQEIGFRSIEGAGVVSKPTPEEYWEFFSDLAVWGSAQDRGRFLERIRVLQ